MSQANQSIRPITLSVNNPKLDLRQTQSDISSLPGDRLEMQMLLFGSDAINLEYGFKQTLMECGIRGGFGDGKNQVGFDLDSWISKEYQLRVPQDLPGAPTDGPNLRRVKLISDSPILDKRLTRPDFRYFFQSSLRCVTRMFAAAGSGDVQSIEYRQLRDSGEVERENSQFSPFQQRHRSSRSGRFGLRGLIGHAEFEGVPSWTIPWLVMGGQIGVGNHRVCGAGRWRLDIQE